MYTYRSNGIEEVVEAARSIQARNEELEKELEFLQQQVETLLSLGRNETATQTQPMPLKHHQFTDQLVVMAAVVLTMALAMLLVKILSTN
jgi:hypothetical protein